MTNIWKMDHLENGSFGKWIIWKMDHRNRGFMDLPNINMMIFHSYVNLPEGTVDRRNAASPVDG